MDQIAARTMRTVEGMSLVTKFTLENASDVPQIGI
jgi:hypothetical protein